MHTTNKGDTTAGFIAMALIATGKKVLIPMTYDSRYDLLLDEDNKFTRIQCKTSRLRSNGEVLEFNACSTNHKGKRQNYIGDIDAFATCHGGKVYIVPIGKSKTSIYLRLKESNRKDKKIRMAKDFELHIRD